VDAPHGGPGQQVVNLVGSRHAVGSRRARQVRAGLPDAVELLRIGADAGLTVPQALAALADDGQGAVAGAVALVLRRVAHGQRLADALESLRVEPALAPLADALIDAERYGAPLPAALVHVAADARAQRRRQAELVARRLPVRLLAPLVLCALPATVVLAVLPVVAVTLQGLAW
jgi:tight adherence protein C